MADIERGGCKETVLNIDLCIRIRTAHKSTDCLAVWTVQTTIEDTLAEGDCAFVYIANKTAYVQ